jgi:hypothetical protein
MPLCFFDLTLNKRRAGKAEMNLDPTGSPRHEQTVAVALESIIAQINHIDNSYERCDSTRSSIGRKGDTPTKILAPVAADSVCGRSAKAPETA